LYAERQRSLGDGWYDQQSEQRVIMRLPLLRRSSRMEIIRLLLIKYWVYLLFLLWKMTVCYKPLSQQGNAQTRRHAHTLLAKLVAEPYKGRNYSNTLKCGRIFFCLLFNPR